MKKLFAIILAAVFVLSVLFACANGGTSETDIGSTANNSPDLPELNFGGQTFTIMHRASTDEFIREFECDASADDVVDQAVYNRNRHVEAQLNISLNYVGNDSTEWIRGYNDKITADIHSGDNIYDVFSGPSYHITTPMVEGCYANLSNTKYLNLDKVYWANGLTDGMAIDGKVYLVTGDVSLGLVKYLHCIIYNKQLFEDYWPNENIYDIVESGNWTVDEMARLCKGLYIDNGGVNGDQYGFTVTNTNLMRALIDSLGIQVIHINSDGEAEVWAENQSHIHDVITQMYDFFSAQGVAYLADQNNTVGYKVFKESRTLFILSRLVDVSTVYREISSFEYGLLPVPVYTEGSEYRNTICGSESAFAISAARDAEGIDRASAVLEALCAESYATVTPEYYETALQIKYDMINEDARMLALIHDGATFSPNVQLSKVLMNNSVGKDNPDYAVTYCMLHDPNWMSFFDSHRATWNTALESLTNVIKSLK